ncbi:O-antigen polymerase [Exiguobacterium sp. PvP096]
MLTLISYFLSGKDIISPWFISNSVYLISSFAVMLNYTNWNIDISQKTVIIIFLASISLGAGELLIRMLFNPKKKKNREKIFDNNADKIHLSNLFLTFSIVYMTMVFIWTFIEIYKLSILGGNNEGVMMMLKYARSQTSEYGFNTFLSISLAFSNSIAYFYIFYIIYNKVFYSNDKLNKFLYLPIILFCLQMILTTGRQIFIQILTMTLITFFILYKKKYGWNSKNTKLLAYSLISVAVFMLAFFLLGFLTDKSFLGFSRTLSLYVGGSIVGLDIFLKAPVFYSNEWIGSNTLFGIYASLNQLGFNFPKLRAPLENFYIGYDSVNVYTPLRRYIQDFSIAGMIFIQFFIGMMYTTILMIIKNTSKISSLIIIFAMFYYPISEGAIEERLFMLVLSLNGIVKALGVFMLYYFIIEKKSPLKIKNKKLGLEK